MLCFVANHIKPWIAHHHSADIARRRRADKKAGTGCTSSHLFYMLHTVFRTHVYSLVVTLPARLATQDQARVEKVEDSDSDDHRDAVQASLVVFCMSATLTGSLALALTYLG